MKHKRKILTFVIALLIVARLFILVLTPFAFMIIFSMYNPTILGDVEVVLEYEDDYNCVAMVYYNDYLKYGPKEGEKYAVYSGLYNGRILRYSDPEHQIELTDEELVCFQNVYNSYRLDDQPWERVVVYDGFVAFSNVNGRVSIVYSVNDERPKYVNGPLKAPGYNYVGCKKITDHWYYVRGYDFNL